jgi:hypothetical protein
MLKVIVGAIACLAAANARAQAPDPEHVCVRDISKWVTFREPESIRVMSLSGPTAEAIDYAGTRLLAYRHTVMVNSRGEQGGYTGARPYTCFTSEDRQRILNYTPRRD